MRRWPGLVWMGRKGRRKSVIKASGRPTGAGSTYGGALATAGRSCPHDPRMLHLGATDAPWQGGADAGRGDAAP